MMGQMLAANGEVHQQFVPALIAMLKRLERSRQIHVLLRNRNLSGRLMIRTRLLDFLQRWKKDTICLRDIYIFGPYALQNEREAAINAAEILASRGWLAPQKANRHDRRVWQVLRKPIIQPTVTRTRP